VIFAILMYVSGLIFIGRRDELGAPGPTGRASSSMVLTMRILIADDDHRLGPVLVRGMATDAIAADLVSTGREAIVRATATSYAAIVLEADLPDQDGFSVCRAIREESVEAPIVFLSARNAVEDRIAGLDSGGDDYLGKPFAFRELLARIRAVTRRGPVQRGVILQVGDLRLDSVRHQVHRGDVAIDLSRKEFAVLEALMREPGSVLSRFDLLEQAWSYHYENRSNVVEVYVRYLREKIDRPFGRHSLQTVRGVGYRLCPDDGAMTHPVHARPGRHATMAA
jgi:two-component system, OmpR family, response regulator